MKQRFLTVTLAALLSMFGFVGCSNDPPADTQQSEVYTADDHNRIYQEGCDLISPYMQLHGVEARAADTEKAREELNRGISLLQRVVEIKPDNWSAFWMMGKGYQALNEFNNACDAFGKSFAMQKNNPDVAREYMLECLNLGRAEDAIAAAKHGVDLDPDDAGLVANLALAYLIGAKLDDAIDCVDKSLALAPDDEITQNLKKIILEVQAGKWPQPKSTREL